MSEVSRDIRGSKDECRVVVIDDDAIRRRATCALLVAEGYAVVPLGDARELSAALDEHELAPTVIVQDVSLPRPSAEVAATEQVIRQIVGRRHPIVLYGDRPSDGVSALDGSLRALVHIPSEDGGRRLVSLVRRLVAANGGAPASNPLDRSPPPASTRTSVVAKSEVKSGTPSPAAIDNVRLLLIDDSEMTLDIMQAKLSAIGFDVRTALSLGEVRALIANWAPNVIVADIRRPDIPEHELCARLKATVHREDVIILLCSSLKDEQIAPLAEAARADGWVSKAHGLDDFAARIQAVSESLLERQSDKRREIGGAS